MRRITRSLKTTVQQQQFIDVDKALQILDQETPPLVVDKVKLKVCRILWVLVYIVTGQIGFSVSGHNSQKPLNLLHPVLFGFFFTGGYVI